MRWSADDGVFDESKARLPATCDIIERAICGAPVALPSCGEPVAGPANASLLGPWYSVFNLS
jgi:hypothetical protein